MDQNAIQKIEQLELQIKNQQDLIEKIYTSVERTRKMIFWTAVVTAALIILPAIGLVFAIPSFVNQYSQIQSLGL